MSITQVKNKRQWKNECVSGTSESAAAMAGSNFAIITNMYIFELCLDIHCSQSQIKHCGIPAGIAHILTLWNSFIKSLFILFYRSGKNLKQLAGNHPEPSTWFTVAKQINLIKQHIGTGLWDTLALVTHSEQVLNKTNKPWRKIPVSHALEHHFCFFCSLKYF